MHHMYPVSKGDQLCPLGFHPQVRWPTRCKRCFRDYKEHGGKRGDDVAASSPSLSEATNARIRENTLDRTSGRSWTSTSNLSMALNSSNGGGSSSNSSNNDYTTTSSTLTLPKRPSSWTSTPDLDENKEKPRPADVVVSLSLPKRRHTTMLDISQVEESITIRRPPLPPASASKETPADDFVILRTDSLAERARKMQLKKQSSLERDSSREKSLPRSIEKEKSPIPDAQAKVAADRKEKEEAFLKSKEIQMLLQMKEAQAKKKSSSSTSSATGTKPESTTHHRQQLIDTLQRELEETKARAERAERDKSDILLRRLASMDTSTNRTAASEALKLQQKVNDLNQQLETVSEDRKALSLRVRELEQDLSSRSAKAKDEEQSKKLKAAEQLCEELMDENEEMKKEVRNLEQEMDEMHDNFREEQADEYTTVKKELDQTTKNCRILSFKFKKSERKIEQLEAEKQTLASQFNSDLTNKVKRLEEELRISNEVARQLKSEVENTQKAVGKGKAPSLGTIGKSTSADGKFSRASLTRGGSQEDPVQLLRDLQDSMERETDIREQLKFAEEEAENLRKKAARVEDENESLMMQLKKMATKARSRKLSPTPPHRVNLDTPVEKDEGISDEEDPAELRVLLELNEQESTQLRRKVEELERNNEASKKQIRELQEKVKVAAKSPPTPALKGKLPTFMSKTLLGDKEDRKLKDLEKELVDLRKQLAESKSTKVNNSSDALELDLKRQLESVEQEAGLVRTKLQQLELENEKLNAENKKLALHAARQARKDSVTSAAEATKAATELTKLKESLASVEEEKKKLETKLNNVLEMSADKLPTRVPKKCSDANTKFQLQKMIGELEQEILEMRAVVVRTGGNKVQKLESEKSGILLDMKDIQDQLIAANVELKSLRAGKESLSTQSLKVAELEQKWKKANEQADKLQDKIKVLQEKIDKQDNVIKQTEAARALLENQMKFDQEKYLKLEKDYDREKKERARWEDKVADIDSDLAANKKSFEKTKLQLEKEITTLKAKTASADSVPTKKVLELRKQNDDLQLELDTDRKRYSELTGRYEQLEEEHVLIKAQLTTDKENLQASLTTTKSKLSDADNDLVKTKREKIDAGKKLTDAQSKIRELEEKYARSSAVEHERNRLKSTLAEREQEFERLRDENDMNKDVVMQMKREIDELKRKLTDFERVNKAQNSMSDHSSNLEQEMKRLKQKLDASELSSKSEVAATRLRYEQQITNLHTEMTSIQRQCEKFKRDRDTFKQLLEGAQKTISDLKNSNSGRISRASMNSGDEDDKSKIHNLERQIGTLEDELCEARLEISRTKTELVSEKSVSEIKISEMQSRMNEYEEDRLINSGRTKIAGMKTKLELSWQKEREDQQRILQETSTLARDLRQTLFEVERERDKERLETRRKLDLLKKANEEELDEGRKKISELQCDLLELRDVHAKMRTSNEKLRRERERFERERESTSTRRRPDQEGERRVGALLQTVDELIKMAPELIPSARQPTSSSTTAANGQATTTSSSSSTSNLSTPRRTTKSRSSSPNPNSIQISTVLARLTEASDDLRKYQRVCDEDRERDKNRRSGMRRAASTETDTPDMPRHRISRSSPQNGSLYRKSLSLDQSMQQPADQAIWKLDDGSMSSMQSIDSEFGGGMVRDSSMDSRLSAGSTQSDMPRGPRKKKRGIMGKLRSLTKGKGAESEGSMQGSDSDVSISSDFKSSKNNLKGRLSGMFKRAGSTSRDSVERNFSDSGGQRPISVTTVTVGGSGPPGNGNNGLPPPTTPRARRSNSRPPTPTEGKGTTPSMTRRAKP